MLPAVALANAVAITSPEAVFFFGGLAQAGELLLEPTRRYLEEQRREQNGVTYFDRGVIEGKDGRKYSRPFR